jgi:hypothetical protein
MQFIARGETSAGTEVHRVDSGAQPRQRGGPIGALDSVDDLHGQTHALLFGQFQRLDGAQQATAVNGLNDLHHAFILHAGTALAKREAARRAPPT